MEPGHGLGWQADAGVAFDIGNRWLLKPAIRYRSLSQILIFLYWPDVKFGTVANIIIAILIWINFD